MNYFDNLVDFRRRNSSRTFVKMIIRYLVDFRRRSSIRIFVKMKIRYLVDFRQQLF